MKRQTSEAEQLRGEIGTRASKRGPLPRSVRERGKAFARLRVRGGASLEAISAQLGLSVKTIERWLAPDAADTPDARAAMLPVHVVRSRDVSTASVDSVVVTTASGLRIEGLGIEGLCALVARCG